MARLLAEVARNTAWRKSIERERSEIENRHIRTVDHYGREIPAYGEALR